jgi:EAL domain-containing protein (putative c-di-GMP-specific phosphodiesterase class I)
LQPILDDAVQHFAHEERLFKQWKYPDVDDLSADPNAAVLLQITQLGHAMHLEVVAEGVETETEYAFLAYNHCDLVQGCYLPKPLSSMELGQLLKKRL